MQKKIVNRILSLFFIVSVSACMNLNLSSKDEEILSDNKRDVWVDASMARFMGSADRNKLQTLVAIAEPKQHISWYSATTGAHFEFTSKKIFVNAKGEGCRNYQIERKRRFFKSPLFDYTACRDSQGIWQVTRQE